MRSGLLVGALLAGCGDDAVSCVEPLERCTPLYAPTFDEVYEQTLAQTCAVSGCHDADTASGGLDLGDIDTAYAMLVDDGRVMPGDDACGVLVAKIEADSSDVVIDGVGMPPSAQLDEAERCAIRQWVREGAAR